MRLKKNRSGAVETTNGVAAGGRSARRGWGPFSGAQLTVIIVAIAVMVMLPVGAFAVSGTNSFITDAVSGKQASVNTSGALSVAPAATNVVIASGTSTAIPAKGAGYIVYQVNVAAYSSVRLSMRETGAPVNSQLIQVLSGGLSLAIDSFVLPGSNASYVYTTPGNTLTVLDLNGSANEADFTWTLVGRTG